MKHHCKLVILCSFNDIGYPTTYKKLQEFTNIQQEEIVLYIIDTPETSLIIYEQMLNNLYSLASHTQFVVVFDRFNPQFKLNKFDLTINLGTKHEGDFNFPLNTKHEVRNIDFKEGIQCNSYQRAANGGTFDHLHFGHKILLSISLLAVKQHLTIGVTGEALLKNKKHAAFLQSYNTRVRCVKEFCSIFRPEIDLFFSELIEPAGPTKDGIYECLIATEETASSLEYINSLRATQGFNKLEGYIIKLIGNEAQKLSSTDIRNQISRVNRLSDQEYLELKTQWLKVSPDLYWFESIIVDYYSQPHRHYHTLRHIYDMVKQLKTQNQILAAFFHDVIYYPKIHDNEERSALLYQQYAKELSIDSEIVSIFILQTKQHSIDVPFLQENDLSELMEFLDADLSILESPSYAIYAQDIRLEYAHYPDQEYKTGRIAVLQKFLNKKLFYLRDDAKARQNILEEIEALQNWKVFIKLDDSPRESTPKPLVTQAPQVPQVIVSSNKKLQLMHPAPVQIQTQAQNVFTGSQDLLKQLPQHDKGPRQDQKGQIVKHTIVGSVQQFMQEKQRRQQKEKKPQVKLQTLFAPDQETQPQNNSYLKLTEHMSSKDLGKKSPGKMKSKDFQVLQINEMEVQQEILQVERRVKINSLENVKMNDQLKKKLNKGDQLKMDTFFRAITNYEQTLDNWEQTNLKVSSRVSRKQGQSMNEKIEQYRVKEEVKQLLDHITPIEQKLGNDYWKQGLRTTESTLKKKYPYKYIDQLELDPSYKVDQKPPVIEVIRRPNTCTSNYRPYSSFTSRFYLDKKLKENEDLVHKLISPVKEVEQLKLEGQNVLKQEINSVRNPRDSFVKITSGVANNESAGFNKYIKKIPIKPEQPAPDEILVQNYSKKTLINTGQFGSLKGYF